MKNYREGIPPFIRPIIEIRPRCPDATIDLLQTLRARDLVSRFCELQKNKGDGQVNSAKANEFCRN